MDVKTPNIFCREMQLNKHHNYAKELVENWFTKHVKKEWKDKTDLVAFCSYCYPNCNDKEKFLLIAKTLTWAFILDDYLDRKPDQFTHWLKVIEAKRALTDHYLEIMFEEIITELFGYSFTYNQKLRIMVGIAIFIQSYEISGDVRQNNKKITLNEFLGHRCADSFIGVMFVFVEWSLDINVDIMWNIRVFQRFHESIRDHTILVNEIYSYKKELKDENNMYYSFMSSLMQSSNMDFDESLKIAVERVGILVKEIECLKKDLDLLSSKVPKAYIEELINIIDGNHYWSKTCKRYIR